MANVASDKDTYILFSNQIGPNLKILKLKVLMLYSTKVLDCSSDHFWIPMQGQI